MGYLQQLQSEHIKHNKGMRTIEFRGRGFDSIKWEYGDLLQYDDGDVCIGVHSKNYTDDGFNAGLYRHIVSVDEDTVGQFTGLKDKNGKGVYEGDIFKDSSGVLRSIFRVPGGLAFEDNPVAFGYDHRAPVYPYSPLAESQNEAWISQCCEVIGNIHDNPELLKGGDK